jgi:hypothetical protein
MKKGCGVDRRSLFYFAGKRISKSKIKDQESKF